MSRYYARTIADAANNLASASRDASPGRGEVGMIFLTLFPSGSTYSQTHGYSVQIKQTK